MIDNRTNEPTPEQVEAAADAAGRVLYPHWDEWEEHEDMAKAHGELMRLATRAALVAAQGVFLGEDVRALAEAEVRKTSAEGNPISEPGVTKDIAFVRGAEFAAAAGAAPQAECPERPGGRHCEASRPGHKLHWSNGPKDEHGNVKLIADARALSEYLSEHIPGSRYKPMIDGLANALEATPVLPSSTVDEDALAEVVEKAMRPIVQKDRLGTSTIYPGPKRIARAVAEWLKGQGR